MAEITSDEKNQIEAQDSTDVADVAEVEVVDYGER